MVLLTQIITAYTCFEFLIPKLLNRKKYLQFVLAFLLLLAAMFVIYNVFKLYYYDPKYYDSYDEIRKVYAQEDLWTRLTQPALFLSKSIKFITPAVLLLMVQFYKDQQQLIALREQKRTAELSALKNQLNPHFLFNTLNNLYALSLEKSDKTPMIIARLSEILDYILFRCQSKFVPLKGEVELIENYLALEKVRYGNRVEIHFEHDIQNGDHIAPLILLTFIENAFKHGIKQEINKGEIGIELRSNDDEIHFAILNTKPKTSGQSNVNALGIKNVKKQLDLLYPSAYELTINDKSDTYKVHLKLKKQDV